MQFCVEGGVVKDAIAYSDGMDTGFIKAAGDTLRGAVFASSEIKSRLLRLSQTIPVDPVMLEDITRLVEEHNF